MGGHVSAVFVSFVFVCLFCPCAVICEDVGDRVMHCQFGIPCGSVVCLVRLDGGGRPAGFARMFVLCGLCCLCVSGGFRWWGCHLCCVLLVVCSRHVLAWTPFAGCQNMLEMACLSVGLFR